MKQDNFNQIMRGPMDNHTPEQRRKNMQAIGSKDTKIEIALRHELWSRGLHYRKNCKGIPGHPDIAFIGKKIAIFCDSEFWHGYEWENRKEKIKTNRDFWISKIERNIQRDSEVNEILRNDGWTVIRFWGEQIRKDVTSCADIICSALNKK